MGFDTGADWLLAALREATARSRADVPAGGVIAAEPLGITFIYSSLLGFVVYIAVISRCNVYCCGVPFGINGLVGTASGAACGAGCPGAGAIGVGGCEAILSA